MAFRRRGFDSLFLHQQSSKGVDIGIGRCMMYYTAMESRKPRKGVYVKMLSLGGVQAQVSTTDM